MSVPAQASRTRTACSCGKASWPTRRAADRGIQCKHRLNRRRLAIDIYSHALPASESRAIARFDVRLGKARRLKRLPKQSDFARDGNRMATDALRRAKNAHAIRPLMERAAGIEPATLAWKARALPLCNARTLWFLRDRANNALCYPYARVRIVDGRIVIRNCQKRLRRGGCMTSATRFPLGSFSSARPQRRRRQFDGVYADVVVIDRILRSS